MKPNRIIALATIAVVTLAGQIAQAQQPYPSKPIREVVPFAAGGPADILARWLGNKLTPALGQPVIIDNKGGAGGLIGAQAVATAPPDGYTLLFASVGAIAVSPYIADKVSYDPETGQLLTGSLIDYLVPTANEIGMPTLTSHGPFSTFALL